MFEIQGDSTHTKASVLVTLTQTRFSKGGRGDYRRGRFRTIQNKNLSRPSYLSGISYLQCGLHIRIQCFLMFDCEL